MKKKKKAITIILIVSILIVGFIFGGYFVTKTVMTKGAFEYLQDKYEMTEEQLDILDYETGRYHLVSTDWIFEPFKIEWHNYKWQFEYNGREFFVNRINGRYYDDYQLDDIQLWATEWLSKNVDEKIVGIHFDSTHLLNYQLNYGNQSVITKQDAIEFFNNACIYDDYKDSFVDFDAGIFVEESYYYSLSNEEKDNILNTIKDMLPSSEFEFLADSEDYKIEKDKIKYSIWIFEYHD
ncbi:MAG: hypothetical protein PUE73_04455 [Eubacteriales bacterium]|nr:hypothetical protein [Eubacteriales bacterium]